MSVAVSSRIVFGFLRGNLRNLLVSQRCVAFQCWLIVDRYRHRPAQWQTHCQWLITEPRLQKLKLVSQPKNSTDKDPPKGLDDPAVQRENFGAVQANHDKHCRSL